MLVSSLFLLMQIYIQWNAQILRVHCVCVEITLYIFCSLFFSPFSTWSAFSAPSSLLSFWDSEDMNVILPVIFPQVPETQLIFPSGYFVSVTRIGSLLLFCLPVYWLFPLSPLPWHQDSPSTKLLISVTVFLSSKIYNWFFFYLLFLCWAFLLFFHLLLACS